jgi:2-polyprenyl-6-methoxyphenol hydroxylase-like FAD-dependent oxidoreductase
VDPLARSQGYRIRIDPQGSVALHQCLPPHLWNIFESTGGAFSHGFSVLTEQLHELLNLRGGGSHSDSIARNRSISRITLRRILLAGLGDKVHFNKRFERFEEGADGKINVHFEDGSRAQADLLVGADGVHSRVRKQYLPGADPVETGVVLIGATIPLSDGLMALAPDRLLDGPVMVVPPTACSLFMAIWKRSSGAEDELRKIGIEEPLAGDEDYLIFGLGGKPDFFQIGNPTNSPSNALPSSLLKDVLRRTVRSWHPNLRKLAELIHENNIYVSPIRTSILPRPWKPTHVTLLGDAIHSMTPYRGIGGNIALMDAASLTARLTEAHQDKKTLLQAVGEYESAMRDYAFAAVSDSLKAMKQFTGEKSPAFPIIKTGMRVVNAGSKLKSKLIPA